MISLITIYCLLAFVAWKGLTNPRQGIIGYYFWVVLEPHWNWRWILDNDGNYQQIIAGSIMIGVLAKGFKFKKQSPEAKTAIACFVFYLGFAYVASINSISPPLTSFFMSYMWKVVLMSVLCVLLIDDSKAGWWMLIALAVAQGYSAFRINEQYFLDGYSLYAMRPWGSKGDNNLFSNLTIPALCCSLILIAHNPKLKQKLLFALIGILQVHQIMLLESRGAFLGTMLALGGWCIVIPKTNLNRAVISIGIAISLALAGPPVVREFKSIWVDAAERDSSSQSRIGLWKAGFEITKSNPLLGVGPFAAQTLVPQYINIQSNQKGLHNQLFQISAGSGIPSLICYSLFFFIPWREALKNRRSLRQLPNHDHKLLAINNLTLIALPSYFLASLFSAGTLSETPYIVAALGLSASSISWRERSKIKQRAWHKSSTEPTTYNSVPQHA